MPRASAMPAASASPATATPLGTQDPATIAARQNLLKNGGFNALGTYSGMQAAVKSNTLGQDIVLGMSM